jgi:hypothetical protein
MRRMIITGVLAATTICGALGAVSALAGNGNGPGTNGHNEAMSPSGSQWV